MLYSDRRGITYRASAPSRRSTLLQLQTRLCRECLRPTKARVRVASAGATRTDVVVCRECARDATGYSSLVDRAGAYLLEVGGWRFSKAAVNRALEKMGIAKRGGNRAHLFWRHFLREELDAQRGRS